MHVDPLNGQIRRAVCWSRILTGARMENQHYALSAIRHVTTEFIDLYQRVNRDAC
ncbi:MAG: hypothetical protein OXB98_15100 [Bryobacterales bacterium]|nr:hypothetical protein [Bryobacterales bacterium]